MNGDNDNDNLIQWQCVYHQDHFYSSTAGLKVNGLKEAQMSAKAENDDSDVNGDNDNDNYNGSAFITKTISIYSSTAARLKVDGLEEGQMSFQLKMVVTKMWMGGQ